MFILMYLNTYLWDHVFWSETRVYMAILMGATMAIIMLAFMLSMYDSKALNAVIFLGAAVVFAGALWLVRSQVTVADTSYMRAMIPHHSIAIMTSSRADISDPRVRKLADEIIYAQDKEIAEMRYLVSDIEANGENAQRDDPASPKLVSLDTALNSAHVAVIDPGFLTAGDIATLFPAGAACTFAYTTESPASLAVGEIGGQVAGLVKLSGDLVRVDAIGANGEMGTDGLRLRISAPGSDAALTDVGMEPREADMELALEAGLDAGYRGFYRCGG
jgi:hypothetical protein